MCFQEELDGSPGLRPGSDTDSPADANGWSDVKKLAAALSGTDARRLQAESVHRKIGIRVKQTVLRDACRSAPVAVGMASNRSIRWANNQLCTLTGYAYSELVGQSVRILYPTPEDFDRVGDEAYRPITGCATAGAVAARWIRKDGRQLEIVLGAAPLDEDNPSAGVVFAVLDDTDRKQMEEKLRSANARLKAMWNAASVARAQLSSALSMARAGHWEYDIAADTFTFNDNFYEVFHTTAVEVGGYTMSSAECVRRFCHPDDRTLVLERIRVPLKPDTARHNRQLEHRFVHTDGSIGHILVRYFSVQDAHGRTLKVCGVNQDITERKQADAEREALQAQLSHAQKMESIGRLAGGVAHDFNNLLTGILGYAELTLSRLSPEEESRAHVAEIAKAAESAARLTRQLLAFSRRQVIKPCILNLDDVIADMDNMLRRLIGVDIDLRSIRSGSPSQVRADRGQIEQVLINLAVNARDAMPEGGRLTIETRNIILDKEHGGVPAGRSEGAFVLLSVTDTGCGMDAETQARVFEPFFTTKELGKGTGLGLATVYGVMEQNGGSVDLYSVVGAGTTFRLYFPRVNGVTEQPVEEERTDAVSGGSETVFLVEDNPHVRASTLGLLSHFGYTALGYPNGNEALEAAQTYPGQIHLLLTDMVMPGIGGRTLADELTKIRPETKVLFASGYTDDEVLLEGVQEQEVHFIAKPYRARNLACKIREVLEDR